jgi:gliding motility-associated-like protein
LNALSVRSFRVTVKPRALAERNVDTLPCGIYSVESKPAENFRGTPSYVWQLLDKDGLIVFDKKTAYFQSTGAFLSSKQFDTIRFRKGGTYIIQHTINNKPNDCPKTYYDTLIVPPLMDVTMAFGPDTFVCAGTTLRLQTQVVNGIPPIKYQWGTPIQQNPADTLPYKDLQVPGWQTDTSLSVIITDKNKCQSWDTIKIYLKPNPYVNIGPDLRICTYDSVLIIPNDSLAYWDDPRDTAEYRIRQGDTLWYEWTRDGNPISTERDMRTSLKGVYTLEVVDSLGCSAIDTMILHVNDTVTAFAGPDQVLCWNDSLTLTAMGLDTFGNGKSGTYRWWDVSSNAPGRINKGTGQILKFPIKVTTDFQLELYVKEDTTTCYHSDLMNVKVNALPVLTLPKDQSVCCDAGDIKLNLLSPTPAPSGGNWYCTKLPSSVVFGNTFATASVCDPNNKTSWFVTYQYTDPTTTCTNRDSMRIVVNPLPRVTLKEGYYCQDLQKTKLIKHVLQPGNPNLGTQEWKCVDCRGYKEADLIKNVGSPLFPDYELNFDLTTMNLGAKNEDTLFLEFSFIDGSGCRNRDTTFFRIVKVPVIKWIGFKPLCWDDGLVSLNTLSKVDPVDGMWRSMDTLGYTRMPTGSISGDTLDTRKTDPLGKTYYMRYLHTASGCPVWKDTTLIINPLPKVNPTPVPALVCESEAPITLSATPSGGTWSSPQAGVVSAGRFSPATSPTGVPLKMIYRYTDPVTGCSGSDSITSMVEALAEVEILTADLDTCRSPLMSKVVSARFANTPSITWMPLSGGTVDNAKGNPVTFTFSTTHDTMQQLLLYVMTEDGNACPFVDDLLTIRVHPIPHVTVTPDDPNGCNPHAVTFNTVFNNKVNPATATYAWDFGDGATGLVQNPVHSYTKEGVSNVSLKVTSDRGCDSSVGLQVEVYPNPQADFTPNPNNYTTAALPRFKFINQSIVSNVLGSYLDKHEWDFGDPNSNTDTSTEHSPMFYYPGDTANYQVWLKVTTNYGCTDSTMRLVRIGPDILVFIPNAFTPGKGGPSKNEDFNVVASGFKTYNMMIFNRWGEIIFESNDINKGWDGTFNGADCQQDVYAYSLKVTSLNDESYEYSGVIHLLR